MKKGATENQKWLNLFRLSMITLIVTDPVLSKEAIEQYIEKKPSYKKG